MRSENAIREVSVPEILTPKGLLIRAGVLTALFALCHVAGLREFTGIISGTFTTGDVSRWATTFLGLAYVLLYLAAIVLAPILVIASLILKLSRR